MRKVLGLSLTATSVAWTLVDLGDGAIVANDVITVDSAENVATVAARSVETFMLKERDIDAVRIAWTEGMAGSALRLTSKLRLLGFDDIDVIAEEAARHGRNRTARYIDPDLELAYGAARTVSADDRDGLLRRLAARVPIPPTRLQIPVPAIASRVSMKVAVASSVVVVAVGAAVAVYSLLGGTRSQPVDRNAEPLASAPTPDGPLVISVRSAAPPLSPPAPEATVAPTLLPALDEAEAAPMVTDEAELATVPETAALPESATAPVPAATMVGQPHLTAEGLSAALLPGPVPPTPAAIVPTPLAAPPPVPNSFDIFDALP